MHVLLVAGEEQEARGPADPAKGLTIAAAVMLNCQFLKYPAKYTGEQNGAAEGRQAAKARQASSFLFVYHQGLSRQLCPPAGTHRGPCLRKPAHLHTQCCCIQRRRSEQSTQCHHRVAYPFRFSHPPSSVLDSELDRKRALQRRAIAELQRRRARTQDKPGC